MTMSTSASLCSRRHHRRTASWVLLPVAGIIAQALARFQPVEKPGHRALALVTLPGVLSKGLLLCSGLIAFLLASWLLICRRRGGRSSPQHTVIIFGVGYTGERLASRLLSLGTWRVLGTSRTPDSRQRLAAALPGIQLFANAREAFSAASQRGWAVTHVVMTAAPGESGDPMLADLGDAASTLLVPVPWVGYLSTVGVYGDCSGEKVDEERPVNPKSKRGALRVAAEQTLAQMLGGRLWIFRLPGIYGVGRGPLQKARSGEARRIVARPGHVFSRIHVDDIVGAIVRSMELAASDTALPWLKQTQPAILNVVDSEPAPGHEVSGFAFELLGKEPPPCTDLEKADLPAIARSFYEESRYVLNDRLKSDVGYELLYPTYREGLRAQLAEEKRLHRRAMLRAWPSRAVECIASQASAARCCFQGAAASRTVVLVDNGSLKAQSTLGLRSVARALQQHELAGGKSSSTTSFIAASARFSDRIDPGELGGERARTLQELLRELRARRVGEVVLLPVFFGPSGMVTEFIPKQVATIRSEPGPRMPAMTLAPTLICDCPFLCPGAQDDNRVARILLERIEQAVKSHGLGVSPAIAVIDHGSPTPAVARCRDKVTSQLCTLLASKDTLRPRAVVGCCMERREGAEYDFNGQLLEEVLQEQAAFREGEVVVALMFLQPGRHAGPEGDVAQIIKKSKESNCQAQVVMTDVIGSHDLLVEILAERLGQAFRPAGW